MSLDLIPCTSPPQEQKAVWMRLAAKQSARHDTWKSAGSSEYSYPTWQDGNCVKDAASTDGTCTVTWKLSPNAPKGSYYVSMLNLEDEVANVRQQFFTLQKSVRAVLLCRLVVPSGSASCLAVPALLCLLCLFFCCACSFAVPSSWVLRSAPWPCVLMPLSLCFVAFPFRLVSAHDSSLPFVCDVR